ncbi:hypothetical protein U8607_08380 [Methylobacterium durans]|uniref:hypothetical protein n=1 Tax=Methylobacterium durans TaxID=2202825 RepID=UPI002AFE66B7|nr:hypothetical protein [Methylobacterium durans]MEA1832098.1 hypothetical protein [Methylobacterium durans]
MLVHEVTDALGGSKIVFDVTRQASALIGSEEPEEERAAWAADGRDTPGELCDQTGRRTCGRRSPESISARR